MGKFVVNYTIHGRTSRTVEAETLGAARERVASEVERDDFEIDVDDFDDVDFTVSEMHPVTRNGKELWTTYVMPSDTRGHASALLSAPLFGGPLEAA